MKWPFWRIAKVAGLFVLIILWVVARFVLNKQNIRPSTIALCIVALLLAPLDTKVFEGWKYWLFLGLRVLAVFCIAVVVTGWFLSFSESTNVCFRWLTLIVSIPLAIQALNINSKEQKNFIS